MAIDPSKTVRKVLSLPLDLWKRVEDYRFDNRIRTEAETLRVLVERGLNIKPSKSKPD